MPRNAAWHGTNGPESRDLSNREKLNELVMDVFLLEEDEVNGDVRRAETETWDSLGTVALAVGVEEIFGYHMTPDEANGLESVSDLVALLGTKGVEIG
jgi:acyl carrier protein